MPLALDPLHYRWMFRAAQFLMVAGFMIALIAVAQRTWGAWPAVYAVLILITGTFALWGLKRIKR